MAQPQPPPLLPPNADVLAIVVARIGDTLLVTPALRALKAAVPQGRLTVLAHPKRAALLANLPFIDRLGGIDKRSAPWRARLPGARHDVAVVWGHDTPLVAYGLRRARAVAAFAAPDLPADPRLIRVPRPQTSIHAVDERLLLAQAVGVAVTDRRLAYAVTAAEKATAEAWLAAGPTGGPLIGIQPVSFPTKRHRDWPTASFIELLQALAARMPAARFVVLGDEAARPGAGQIAAAVGERVRIAAGQFDLRASAALIAELDLYIGVDTGPTHIAGALGVPMVALYHCAYPGRNLAPLDHPALRMIEHPATGSPGAGIERGMDEIPVAPVLAAALELLAVGGST